MTGEKLKEFIRRLQAEGYEPKLDEHGAGIVYDGGQNILMMEDGEIRYKSEYRALAMNIKNIRDEVDEYMTAYLAAAPEIKHPDDKSKLDTRTLILFNGNELAGRQSPERPVDFVTWAHDRNGEREVGHYFSDYSAAKEDFAIRTGLIDRDKLFTETELTVIRSNLAEFITIDGGAAISWEDEKDMRNIIEKIDNVIVPEVKEQKQESENGAEDEDFEPEYD